MSTIITDNPYTFTVADNMNINAVFEDDLVIKARRYPAVYNNQDSSKFYISMSPSKPKIGDTCTLTATSVDNTYSFVGWCNTDTERVESTNRTYTFTVNGPKTLWGVFYKYTNNQYGYKFHYNYFNNYSGYTNSVPFKWKREYCAAISGLQPNVIYTSDLYYTQSDTSPGDIGSCVYIRHMSVELTDTTNHGIVIYNDFLLPIFLVHDSADWYFSCDNFPYNILGGNLGGFTYFGSAGSASTSYWAFGPRETTIYVDPDHYTWTKGPFVFQSYEAPEFTHKITLPSTRSTTIGIPSYGSGYNNDWVDRNFTYTTGKEPILQTLY